MEIQSVDLMVDYVMSSKDKEEVKRMIIEYGNVRSAWSIECAWDKALRFFKAVKKVQKKRIQNEILDYDELNGCISLKEFTKYYFGVEDELMMYMRCGDEAHRNAAADISATLANRLGDLKLDRRILFAKDEE